LKPACLIQSELPNYLFYRFVDFDKVSCICDCDVLVIHSSWLFKLLWCLHSARGQIRKKWSSFLPRHSRVWVWGQ